MAGLAGVQVVQLGREAAVEVLGALLGDQGAEVVVVADQPSTGPFGRNKRLATASDREALIACADVVLTSSGGPIARPPGCVWCHLHAGDLAPVEDLVAAATGLHEPPVGLRPRFHDVPIATMVGAAWAASGIVAALLARRRDGRGQLVEIDLREAALASTELLAFFTDRPSRAFQPLQWVTSPFVNLHPCREGHLFVHLGLAHHLRRFLDLLGDEGDALRNSVSAETLADPGSMGGVREAVRVTRVLRELLGSATAEEWEARFPNLCLAAVRSVDEWMNSSMAQEAGHVVELDGARVPGPAVVTSGTSVKVADAGTIDELLQRWTPPTTPWGHDDRPPLAGVKVLDVTAVIAGPVAGRTLAELGADVLRIDDPWFRPAWADAFHALFDRGKRSVWLDLAIPGERAQFDALVESFAPDVLVQNFRPGVAGRLGLLDVAEHVVSLSAFGDSGPWAVRPGWEQTVQAAAGMQHRYGAASPELFPVPVHDLVTGLFGSFAGLVSLYGGGSGAASLAATSTWLMAASVAAPHEDRWRKDAEGWVFEHPRGSVRRARVGDLRAASPLVHREHRADLGSFTRIDSPLRLSGTPGVEGESRPRGWATAAVTGGVRPSGDRELPRRRTWWPGRVRWALGVVFVRTLG